MKKRIPWNIVIVGAGKVGRVLGRVLVEEGENIVAVVSRTKESARQGAKYLRCRNYGTSLSIIIPPATDLILIATPHAAIAGVARRLATEGNIRYKGVRVCHASGMLTAEVLRPLKERGAIVFSFHPIQTFPRDFSPARILPSARGIYYGVDGTPTALKAAIVLARKLGGYVLPVPAAKRAFYHAACVLASNHLTAMMANLSGMYAQLGNTREDFFEVFKPIIMTTLANIERTSPEEALSGPVARAGIETVDGHFHSIKRIAPELIPYFAALTIETARLAFKKGSIDSLQQKALHDLVESHLHSSSHAMETL